MRKNSASPTFLLLWPTKAAGSWQLTNFPQEHAKVSLLSTPFKLPGFSSHCWETLKESTLLILPIHSLTLHSSPGFRPIHSSGNLQSANSSSPRLCPWPPQPSPSGCPVASLPFLCDLPSCALLLPSLLLLNLSLALPSFWSCLLETDDFQHFLVPATLLCAHLVFPAVHYTSLFG